MMAIKMYQDRIDRKKKFVKNFREYWSKKGKNPDLAYAVLHSRSGNPRRCRTLGQRFFREWTKR